MQISTKGNGNFVRVSGVSSYPGCELTGYTVYGGGGRELVDFYDGGDHVHIWGLKFRKEEHIWGLRF